jgi:hypothetical protein
LGDRVWHNRGQPSSSGARIVEKLSPIVTGYVVAATGPQRDRCVRMIASERPPRSERVSITLHVDGRFGIIPARRER